MAQNDELTISICKIGGPLVLFVCTPIIGWIFWKVTEKQILIGGQISTQTTVQMVLFVLAGVIFGIWMCRKGYGWFGGKKY